MMLTAAASTYQGSGPPEVIEWTARFVDLAQPIVTATVFGAVNLIVNSHPLGGSIMTTSGEFKYLTTLLQSGYIRTANFIRLSDSIDYEIVQPLLLGFGGHYSTYSYSLHLTPRVN